MATDTRKTGMQDVETLRKSLEIKVISSFYIIYVYITIV